MKLGADRRTLQCLEIVQSSFMDGRFDILLPCHSSGATGRSGRSIGRTAGSRGKRAHVTPG